MNIELVCNTPDEVLFENVRINSQRALPWLKSEEAHEGHAVLVGGGPSMSEWIEEIRMRKDNGQRIFALNGVAKFLKQNGIESDYCVVVDARGINSGFMGYARHHLLASQCDPILFDAAKEVTLWHQEYPENMKEFDSCLPSECPEHALIGGGTTVGLSAMAIAYALGFRQLHLYGYDSSYKDERLHAYEQHDPQRIECINTVEGKSFKTTLTMARQAELFPQLADSLIELGCTITIRGDGLLPWVSACSSKKPLTEEEKYRLMWSIKEYGHYSPGEEVADDFLKIANPRGHVLDIGCGTGRGGLRIKESGLDVTLVDFVDNSRDENAKSLSFVIADVTKEIPVKGDFGFCADMMEHLPTEDVEKAINNIMASCPEVFFQISLVPDHFGKVIGHTLHLTVKPFVWWYELFKGLGYTVAHAENRGHSALFHISTT